MSNDCLSACMFCRNYKDCEDRIIPQCSCGNTPRTVFSNVRKNNKGRIIKIEARVECDRCGKKTERFKYEYEAISAWKKGEIK